MSESNHPLKLKDTAYPWYRRISRAFKNPGKLTDDRLEAELKSIVSRAFHKGMEVGYNFRMEQEKAAK